jgi:hypothetical protein
MTAGVVAVTPADMAPVVVRGSPAFAAVRTERVY